MVFKKCFKCNKIVTKKTPGLECSRCNKVVHAIAECANLANKQIQALRSTPGLEWSCSDCLSHTPRHSSFFIPDDDEEIGSPAKAAGSQGTGSNVIVDMKKLLRDISGEMEKLLKKEMEPLQHSLTFISDQLTDTIEKLAEHTDKIKKLENQNVLLQNQNKGLELRVAVLEQRSQDTDQKLLSNSLEISGVPAIPEQTPASIADKVASKLNIKSKDIQSARRLPGRQDKTGGILVELRNQIDRDQWILAAKQHEIKVGDLNMQTPIEAADSRIFIREALTINMKTLLFNAKQRMRDAFKYIWCKDGRILVRKTDNSKVQAIRCLADIDSLLK